MRPASYNVENLFDRARVMNESTWEEGSQILGDFASLNQLLGKKKYTASDKTKMVEHLVALGLERSDSNKYVILRSNRGKLLSRPRAGGVTIVASGRADWAGSLELVEVPVDDVAMQNTARVIRDVNADVLGVVEAESRPSLSAFNDVIVSAVGGTPYEHVMLIDGNDTRGIDVGIMSRGAYPIVNVASHVDDEDAKGKRIFSRDCPEYLIQLPSRHTPHTALSPQEQRVWFPRVLQRPPS